MEPDETSNLPEPSKTEKFVASGVCLAVATFVLEPLVTKGIAAVKQYIKNR